MRLLLIEDKDSFRRLLVQALVGTAWTVRATGEPEEGLRWLEAEPAEVLVTDLRLPGLGGLEVIRRARRLKPDLKIVLMSAFGEPKDIVEAMRLGAEDFLPKPFDLEAFLALLDRLGALAGAPPPDPQEPWVALSPAMRALEAALMKAADSEAPVLFAGPDGSGRGRAARRLHTLRSPRGPYRVLEGAALAPDQLTPDALRTLQGGSLMIARLEALPPSRVGDLLRALDSPLGQGLRWVGSCREAASLPEALRLRLGVLLLEVPSLAERREECGALFRTLLQGEARRLGRPVPMLDRPAEKQLLARPWAGQVRELALVARQVLVESDSLLVRHLPEAPKGAGGLQLAWPDPGPLDGMLKTVAREAERALLLRALADAGGDLPRGASHLGLTVRSLGLRLRDHGISLDDEGMVIP